MTTFFTSDQHLGHVNIRKFEPGRLALGDTVDEMNEELIRRWNSVVTADDTVWVLGDWAMGKIADTLPLTARFNGHKKLVLGNHDRPWLAPDRKWQDAYMDAGFKWVMHGPAPLGGLLMSHFPWAPAGRYDARYIEHHPIRQPGVILLHGHVHSHWKYRPGEINVGCDVHDYYPRSIEDLLTEYREAMNSTERTTDASPE